MRNTKYVFEMAVIGCGVMLLAGCVERKLTIVTEPEQAVVWLTISEVPLVIQYLRQRLDGCQTRVL